LYIVTPSGDNSWTTTEVERLRVGFAGIPGDSHEGTTRKYRNYESKILRGEVANDKQLSWVSVADVEAVAEALELPINDIERRTLAPISEFMARHLGANMLFGFTDSKDNLNSTMSPGLLFTFGTPIVETRAAVIRATEYNLPCGKPITSIRNELVSLGIEHNMSLDDYKQRFKNGTGANKRGWVGSVYRAGDILLGADVYTHQPILPPGSVN
ncbi:MAG: hypothetical protein M3Q79_01355, partial [bacterium]|nr:hypothetical protein [bacterium]